MRRSRPHTSATDLQRLDQLWDLHTALMMSPLPVFFSACEKKQTMMMTCKLSVQVKLVHTIGEVLLRAHRSSLLPNDSRVIHSFKDSTSTQMA